MTKKKTEAKSKTTNAKTKSTITKKKTSNAKKKANIKNSQTREHTKLLPTGAVDEYKVDLLPLGDLDQISEDIKSAMELFQEISEHNLTSLQRRRKKGAGIRNYGFIEKVADLAEANPQYAQFFDPNDLRNAIMNFDLCRNILLLLQGFVKMMTDTMLVYSDGGLSMSLIFYNMVKEMGRRGDPIAGPLFTTLQPFFKKRKPVTTDLTGKQTEREVNALLKNKKDGKIIIENIKPKLTGGVHKVIEEKFNDTEQFKETKDGKITE